MIILQRSNFILSWKLFENDLRLNVQERKVLIIQKNIKDIV